MNNSLNLVTKKIIYPAKLKKENINKSSVISFMTYPGMLYPIGS